MSDCVGLKFSVLEDGLFSTSKVDPVYPIAILLATLSKEYFQPYRLTNALIYLQRNGVDLNSVLLGMVIYGIGVFCIPSYGSSTIRRSDDPL